MRRLYLNSANGFLAACLVAALAASCSAQNITVPISAVAGEPASIAITGSGKATLYILGPGISTKQEVNLGEDLKLRGDALRSTGDYHIIASSDSCNTATFYMPRANPPTLPFLVHRGPVPVASK